MLLLRALSVSIIACSPVMAHAKQIEAPGIIRSYSPPPAVLKKPEIKKQIPIIFQHGDVSWLPELATQAGWPPKTHKRLAHIILRESGGCPYRAGGDVVDKDCNVIRVSEWNHRSDTGLLQINGVHWKEDHKYYHGLVCKQMGVCDQQTLMDPLTNLKAGKLLFDVAGWSPWFPQG